LNNSIKDDSAQTRLRWTVSQRHTTILVSAISSIPLAAIACFVAEQRWPLYWLPVDILLTFVRWHVASRMRSQPVSDNHVALSMMLGYIWMAWMGLGIVLSLASGHPGLSVVAAVIGAGIACGTTARNAATPVYACAVSTIMCLSIVLGAMRSPLQGLTVVAVFLVPWMISLWVLVYDNHAILKRLVQAEMVSDRIARIDPLTGLHNRTHLVELSSKVVDRRRFGLLCIDLDGFKIVNDSFGHFVGDQALREVAQRAKAALRDKDTIVRVGGDEFVVFLAEANAEECNAVSARLLAAINRPFVMPDGSHTRLSASIGSTCNDGTTPFGVVLNVADQAMYRAKAAGKDTHIHVDLKHESAADILEQARQRSRWIPH
jgi:diguanylate cyclase (GGDEF)-like protein